MELTVFEARQRAQELINQAVQLWQGTPGADKLEGLDEDPVFKMLFSALAYQCSLWEAETSRLKQDLLAEVSDYLMPKNAVGALPATAVIATNTEQGVAAVEADENLHFYLNGNEGEFLPLFKSRVVNIKNTSVIRLDGRRWKIEWEFGEPIRDLSGFSFAIKGCDYKLLRVYTANGSPLNVIYPWQLAELPFNRLFNTDTFLFNQGQIYSPGMVCMDLFVRENTAVYTVKDYVLTTGKYSTVNSAELVFEFDGIQPDFVFDKDCLVTNCLLLANISLQNATLGKDTPIVRVSGRNFLHLVPTSFKQNLTQCEVMVKTHTAERFSARNLMETVNLLLAKLDNDKAAFSAYTEQKSDELVLQLRDILLSVRRLTCADNAASCNGTYLMLKDTFEPVSEDYSLRVDYLTTSGSAVNITKESTFIVPQGLDRDSTRQIAEPCTGSDVPVENETLEEVRYNLLTGDRLVTPADIKLFCLKELILRYGLDRDLICHISVGHRPTRDDIFKGYEVVADIVLANNPYVAKTLLSAFTRMETSLEKMIEVRTANIYPVRVHIMLDNAQ